MRWMRRGEHMGARCLTIAIAVAMVATATVVALPVVADAEPAPALTASYAPVQPCRLLDTRTTAGARITGGSTITVQIAGRCGVPDGAVAAAISVTAVDTAASGFLTVWPTDQPRPLASTITWARAGEVRANGSITGLSPDGAITLFANVATDVVVDVSGAFAPTGSARAGRFVAMAPARLTDTRDTTRPAPGSTVRVALPDGVPDDAMALAVGITATDSNGPGFFSAYPAGSSRPNASLLNTTSASQTVAASAIVPVNGAGLDVFTQAGGHVIVDVFGYFTGPTALPSTGGLFVAATPTRVLDTRTSGTPLYTDGSMPVNLAAMATGAGPGQVAAIVANVTATQSRGSGFVTAFATQTAKPFVSNLNFVAGDSIADMAVVASSTQGVSVYANKTTHLIVDVTGWFTGAPLLAGGGHADVNLPPASPELPGCPRTGRAAVADKAAQRFWLCQDGYPATDALPMTTGSLAYYLPPPGTYHVFAKLGANTGIHGELLYRFVAFYTTPRGNRIAFHEVVHQTPDSVGDLALRGASSGCFRVRHDDSVRIWDFLQLGDPVVVISA